MALSTAGGQPAIVSYSQSPIECAASLVGDSAPSGIAIHASMAGAGVKT